MDIPVSLAVGPPSMAFIAAVATALVSGTSRKIGRRSASEPSLV